MPATIRPISHADVEPVHALLRELAEYEKLTHLLTGTPDMLRDALFGDGPRLRGLVAEQGGRLIGYAIFFPVFGSFRARWRLYLEDIYVTPSARGTGAGLGLMAALARTARDEGYCAIDWEVLEWNRPALEFYNRLGAAPIGEGWFRYRLDGPALHAVAALVRGSG